MNWCVHFCVCHHGGPLVAFSAPAVPSSPLGSIVMIIGTIVNFTLEVQSVDRPYFRRWRLHLFVRSNSTFFFYFITLWLSQLTPSVFKNCINIHLEKISKIQYYSKKSDGNVENKYRNVTVLPQEVKRAVALTAVRLLSAQRCVKHPHYKAISE